MYQIEWAASMVPLFLFLAIGDDMTHHNST